jgi:hypothetical protein
MRFFVMVACALLSAGCAKSRGVEQTEVTGSVRPPVDSLVRIAMTQLQSHGFRPADATNGIVVTQPQDVPAHLRDSTGVAGGRQWVIQVTASHQRFFRGTQLRVAGFIVPGSPASSGGNAVSARGIPITSANGPLFAEVRTIYGWISDAASRWNRK